MANQVSMTAMCQCSFGSAPMPLMVNSQKTVLAQGPLAATIMDNMMLPFATCSSPANPAVVAALGSPVPCTPVCPSPWMPGSPTVFICGKAALNNSSKLMCNIGSGIISIISPPALTVMIP